MDKVSRQLQIHYEQTYLNHGATPQGVDWGSDGANLELRYSKMLSVINDENDPKPSLLDVGCGYGGLLTYAKKNSISLEYTGLDLVEGMLADAVKYHPEGSFLNQDFSIMGSKKKYSYIVCNGILTQKLNTPGLEMDHFAKKIIRKMFELCEIGIAFNIMTNKVNFYSNNLYYKSPSEMVSWCMDEVSTKIKLDHSYPLYEYTIYLYR